TIVETVSRAGLRAVQTPQAFRRDWLVAAYARRDGLSAKITDDAQLVEALGHTCHVVPGSLENLKITTVEDLRLAEAILPARGEGRGRRTPVRRRAFIVGRRPQGQARGPVRLSSFALERLTPNRASKECWARLGPSGPIPGDDRPDFPGDCPARTSCRTSPT